MPRVKQCKFLFALLIFSLFTQYVNSQSATCPEVFAGNDVVLDCDSTCTIVQATMPDLRGTGTYIVDAIPSPTLFSGTGTPISVGMDDIWSPVINLPFNFCFYGTTYSQLVVGSNGIVSFDVSYAGLSNVYDITLGGIPNTSYARASVMGPYHDIDPTIPAAGKQIHWYITGTAPCRKFVVSFENVPMFSCNSLLATHQIVLHEGTNVIDVLIDAKPVCSSWNNGWAIVGLQNFARTIALAAPGRNATVWTGAAEGWRFIPNGLPLITSIDLYKDGVLFANGAPYTSSPGIRAADFNVCPADSFGTYTVRADYNLCPSGSFVSWDTMTITKHFAFSITDSVYSNQCNGDSLGYISVDTNGAVPPVTYLWNTGDTTPEIDSLGAGIYWVEVTDSANCSLIDTFEITEPDPIMVHLYADSVVCGDLNSGLAFSIDSGGTGPLSHVWNTMPATLNDSITAAAAGTYTVIVTDSLGCFAVDSITVYSEPQIVLQVDSIRNANCNDSSGLVILSQSGGFAPYRYSLDSVTFQTSDTFFNLPSANYIAYILDANNCADSISFNVPTVSLSYTEYDTVNICAGNSYFVEGAIQTTTGEYRDSLITVLGCDSIIVTQLYVNDTFRVIIDTAICAGQTIFLQGVLQSTNGTYFDTLQTVNSCDSLIITNLTVNDTFRTVFDTVICQGNTVIAGGAAQSTSGTYTDMLLTVNGCDSIIVTNLTVNDTFRTIIDTTVCQGEGVITGAGLQLVTGTYVDRYLTINGCDSIIVTNLTVNDTFRTFVDTAICAGQTIFLQGALQSAIGTYFDTLQTVNGCDSLVITNLSINDTFRVVFDTTICQGSTVIAGGAAQSTSGTYFDMLLTVNGCDSIIVTNLTVNDTFRTIIDTTVCQGEGVNTGMGLQFTPGTYVDRYLTTNGCDSTIVTNITVIAPIFDTIPANICDGDSILIDGIYRKTAGTFTDSLTSIIGCDSIVTINLTITPRPNLLPIPDSTICSNKRVDLSDFNEVGLTGTFDWYTIHPDMGGIALFNTMVGPFSTTTYWVVYTENGCSDIETVIVNVIPSPDLNDIADVSLCGATSQLQLTDYNETGLTGTFNWYFNNPPTAIVNPTLISPLVGATQYWVVYTEGICTDTSSLIVQKSGIVLDYQSNDISCFGYNDAKILASAFNGIPPYTYSIDGANYSASNTFVDLKAGVYTLSAKDAIGCETSVAVTIIEPDPVIVSINPDDVTIKITEQIELSTEVNYTNVIYEWTSIEGLSCSDCPTTIASPFFSTRYNLLVTDTAGCFGTASADIVVESDYDVYTPNAFTPNGDGINDVFMFNTKGVIRSSMKVFDRWGEKLFDSESQYKGWDGTYKGEMLKPGVYIYHINLKFLDNNEKTIRGSVTLIR